MSYYTHDQALTVARGIKSLSQVPLTNVYVFGSILRQGYGNDIDILIEVPDDVFKQFCEACNSSGVDYIVRGKLENALHMSDDLFWCYFSLVEVRAERACSLLGLSRDEILRIEGMNLPRDALDIILLPTGWNTPSMIEKFQAHISAQWKCDPNFMKNLSRTALLVE